jgi:phosphoribosylformylglycinamidine synthase
VIERTRIGRITPAFVDGRCRARCGRPVRGLRDEDLLALDRDRGMALDLEELRAIAGTSTISDGTRRTSSSRRWRRRGASTARTRRSARRSRSTTARGRAAAPQLRDATDAVAAPFVRSAFVGNAGIVSFHPAPRSR